MFYKQFFDPVLSLCLFMNDKVSFGIKYELKSGLPNSGFFTKYGRKLIRSGSSKNTSELIDGSVRQIRQGAEL
jgi:hypothetical protein